MRSMFPYLRAIARRMNLTAPWRDPEEVIGTCRYCDDTVTYGTGDEHPDGGHRHDVCERLLGRRQTSKVSSEVAFTNAINLLHGIESARPVLLDAIRAMPERPGPREMVDIIILAAPFVSTDNGLSLQARRDIIVELGRTKRELLRLAAN